MRPASYSPTHLRDTALKPLIVLRLSITLQSSRTVRSSDTNRYHGSKQFVVPAELLNCRYISSPFDLSTDVRRLLWPFYHDSLEAPARIATTKFPELTDPFAVGRDAPHGNGQFEPCSNKQYSQSISCKFSTGSTDNSDLQKMKRTIFHFEEK